MFINVCVCLCPCKSIECVQKYMCVRACVCVFCWLSSSWRIVNWCSDVCVNAGLEDYNTTGDDPLVEMAQLNHP